MHLLGTRGVFTRMILKLMGYKVSKEEGRKFVEIAVAKRVMSETMPGWVSSYVISVKESGPTQ